MTADVALNGRWICPFATRVEFALHPRGIDHELINLPPSAVRGPDFVLPDEFTEHSPHLEIPMVRVGNDYLADSIPVLELMEERVATTPLLPADETGRKLVRERMAWIDRHAFRPMIGICYDTEPVSCLTTGWHTPNDAGNSPAGPEWHGRPNRPTTSSPASRRSRGRRAVTLRPNTPC